MFILPPPDFPHKSPPRATGYTSPTPDINPGTTHVGSVVEAHEPMPVVGYFSPKSNNLNASFQTSVDGWQI